MALRMRVSIAIAGCVLLAAPGCFSPDDGDLTGSSSGTDASTGSGGPTPTGTTATPEPTTGSSGTTTATGTTTVDPTSTTTVDPTTTTGTDSTGTTEGTETTAVDPCGDTQRCVPEVPEEWDGPLVLGPQADCPAEYPTAGPDLFDGLDPDTHSCNCVCGVSTVECQLHLENSGEQFIPDGTCNSPPEEDECISADAVGICTEQLIEQPAEPSWNTSVTACGGATPGNICGDDGSCFDNSAGPICIQRAGEHECPGDFTERTLLFDGYEDTRSCTACNCNATGQACEARIEVCSVGLYEVDLQSGEGCEQLSTGDGDGVDLLSSSITAVGQCNPSAGAGTLSGDITEGGQVTVCCLPE